MTRMFASLGRDRRGSPAVEFALIFPVAITLMLGLGDLAFQGYLQSVLTGAVQKAGRDSTIQGNATQTDAIDQKVINAVKSISPAATFVASRQNYDNYGAIGPEPYTDTNHNGVRDPGECYSDVNGNGSWDADPGSSGEGGASDVTLYKMTVVYPRLFPFAWLIGWSNSVTVSATTILKNQPYQTQVTTTVVSKCTP